MLAFLVSCTLTLSPTGQTLYVGTYQFGSYQYIANFSSYCPPSITVQ